MAERSVSRDENGHPTQIDYTNTRPDGKVESRHVNPDTGNYTGKNVSDTDTGKTDYYTSAEADMGSCCYVTTACLKALGKSLDSPEFTAMKVLTKEHILKSRAGKRDYITYRKIGPKIVQAVESRPDRMQIWDNVYASLQETARFVYSGKNEDGYRTYKGLVHRLEAQTATS